MKRIGLILLSFVVFGSCWCNLTGCAYANPSLRVSGPGGWSADASTNAEVTVEGLDASKTADGGTFKADRIAVKSDAAVVREANVKQMQAHIEQIRAHYDGLAKAIDAAVPAMPWNVAGEVLRELGKLNAQIQVANAFAVAMGEAAKTQLPISTSQPAK